MDSDEQKAQETPPDPVPGRALSEPARRALAEAAARKAAAATLDKPAEIAGRGGLDPVRYGDWEIRGLASDF